jgi:Flp pilus assembly protein TadB
VNDPTKGAGLGAGLVALLAVACCAGLPLIVGAGLSVALLAWVGGIVAGVVALAAALALIALRARRRRAAACNVPEEKLKEVA